MKTVLLVLSLFTFFLTLPARAALDFEDHAFPEFVTSARALAMGNAFINKSDDAWSAFYNPAGLGTVRKPNLHLGNIHMEANNGLLHVLGPGPAYEIPKNYMNSFDPNDMRAMLKKDEGTLTNSRVNLFPNLTLRGMTLGFLGSQRNRAIINNDTANRYEFAERRDYGPVFALSGSFFGGVLKFGASGVYLFRREIYKSVGPTEEVSVTSNDFKTGQSVQVTGATRLTLPVALLPTFSLVLRNATNSKFSSSTDAGAPDKIKQTMDAGFSITPQIGQTSRIHMEVNLKDLNNAYDTDIKRRMAAGVELDFNRSIFLRAGWGDGWGSGGIGLRSRTFILDMTTYAIDRSLDGFRKEEDRRWVLSISSGY